MGPGLELTGLKVTFIVTFLVEATGREIIIDARQLLCTKVKQENGWRENPRKYHIRSKILRWQASRGQYNLQQRSAKKVFGVDK